MCKVLIKAYKPTFIPESISTFTEGKAFPSRQISNNPSLVAHFHCMRSLSHSPLRNTEMRIFWELNWKAMQSSATFIFDLFDNVTKKLKTKRQEVVESMMRKKQTWRQWRWWKKGKGFRVTHILAVPVEEHTPRFRSNVVLWHSFKSHFFSKIEMFVRLYILGILNRRKKKLKKFTSLPSMLVCCKWGGWSMR